MKATPTETSARRLSDPVMSELQKLAASKAAPSLVEVGVGVSALGSRVLRIIEVVGALVNPKALKDKPLFEVRPMLVARQRAEASLLICWLSFRSSCDLPMMRACSW
jgi:hypothetical protein